MKSVKDHQEEEEEYVYEDFVTRKDAPPPNNNTKDGKNSDKTNAIRSKHSVTEQRRRSKINERFQILRELIPNSDQKRDTASFLLEVIQYVQYLQEKVQKYEGPFQPWNSEPTKLMPWRNSHWRSQNFVGQTQNAKNGSSPGSTYPGRFDENCVVGPTSMQTSHHHPIEPDLMRDASCRSVEPKSELPSKAVGIPMPLQASMPVSSGNDGGISQTLKVTASDAQLPEYSMAADATNHQDELTVEGGTISISSTYSQGLLNSLTQALESTGLDFSQANISVQINLGKRSNRGSIPLFSTTKDNVTCGNQPKGSFHDATYSEDFDQAQKRMKI
ncbi:transcription factor BIM2-like isoform X1 [Primulina huaijiensis]|uniref:transcription factor BIM2-like isoform X1 n=1 Tax=Primulina huaijiensis TaxID=1492673 RepID=UPI003CC78E37